MSTGYIDFWIALLKAHPEVVVDIETSEDGSKRCIVLGGVVVGKDGDISKHTTNLTIVVTIRLCYNTINGQPIVHKIALGRDVAVNTIVGKPFIDTLHCVHDSFNKVVEAKLLDCKPFRVTEMIPQRYACTKAGAPNTDGNYAAIVATLTKLHKKATNAKHKKPELVMVAPEEMQRRHAVAKSAVEHGWKRMPKRVKVDELSQLYHATDEEAPYKLCVLADSDNTSDADIANEE
jgi:hypothetical protein